MSETAEQTEKKHYAVGERSIVQIIKDLSKPVAQKHLKQKRQGGTNIDFISWFDRIKYLDFYAPGWSNEITRMESIGGKLIITVRLNIPTKDGVISREATGQESEDKDSLVTAARTLRQWRFRGRRQNLVWDFRFTRSNQYEISIRKSKRIIANG